MSLVWGDFRVTVQAIDDDKAKSTHSVFIPGDTNPTAALNFAEEYADLVAATLETAVTGVSLNRTAYDDEFPAGPAQSDVEDKGVLIVATADNARSALALPGIDETYLVDSGVEAGIAIDITAEPIAALITALIDGLTVPDEEATPTLVQPRDSRGQDFVRLTAAYKQNRRSFKSKQRRG
jgi:hypothetical protein